MSTDNKLELNKKESCNEVDTPHFNEDNVNDTVQNKISISPAISTETTNDAISVLNKAIESPSTHSISMESKITIVSNKSIASSPSKTYFPSPFNCCGDFCDIILQDNELYESDMKTKEANGILTCQNIHMHRSSSQKITATSAIQSLYSVDEIASFQSQDIQHILSSFHIKRLQCDKTHANSKSNTALDTPGAQKSDRLWLITYKSIALGKFNYNYMQDKLASQQRKRTGQPLLQGDSTGCSVSGNSNERIKTTKSIKPHAYADAESIANYSRQVRVCENCYKIYTLLDFIRQHKNDKLRKLGKGSLPKSLSTAEILHNTASPAPHYSSRRLKYGNVGNINGMPVSVDIEGNEELPKILLPSPASVGPESSYSDTSTYTNDSTISTFQDSPTGISVDTSGSKLPSIERVCTPGRNKTSPFRKHPILSKEIRPSKTIGNLDSYLRGESPDIDNQQLEIGELFYRPTFQVSDKLTSKNKSEQQMRRKINTGKLTAKILIIDSDVAAINQIHSWLSEPIKDSQSNCIFPCMVKISSACNAEEALGMLKHKPADIILCERDLANTSGLNGLEFTTLFRQQEMMNKNINSRTIVVCLSTKTSAADLKMYRDTGMDGCIKKPLERNTLYSLISSSLTRFIQEQVSIKTSKNKKYAGETTGRGRHNTPSSIRVVEAAARQLQMPGLLDYKIQQGYQQNQLHLDSSTVFPYCVMGYNLSANELHHRKGQPSYAPFFNLVIVHDLFDTWERLQILLHPLVVQYRGNFQVLLWNYPGQAYTTWRPGCLLNNTYISNCLMALLEHVGAHKIFDITRPYFLLGIGNGGNIATMFIAEQVRISEIASTKDPRQYLRGLILVNSFIEVSPKLALFFHDSLKVLASTPDSRPDLPVYFHSRFLFSPAYLSKVKPPIALNLYTAVHNPITIAGRKALCNGALSHNSIISNELHLGLNVPIISICSLQNKLVDALTMVENFCSNTKYQIVDSIAKALQPEISVYKRRCCIVSLASGHEVFQESKKDILILLEQLIVGLHESRADSKHKDWNGLSLTPAPIKSRVGQFATKTGLEDSFLNRVVSKAQDAVLGSNCETSTANSNKHNEPQKEKHMQEENDAIYETLRIQIPPKNQISISTKTKTPTFHQSTESMKNDSILRLSTDPTKTAFERLTTNFIYKIGDGSKIYPDTPSNPSPKAITQKRNFSDTYAQEYMTWRVKRNCKRLKRMEHHARVIQKAVRAYFARKLLHRLRSEKLARIMLRIYKVYKAKCKLMKLRKRDWAIRLVQRTYRGRLGRLSYRARLLQYLAARTLQAQMRGALARLFVKRLRLKRKLAAVYIQKCIRRYLCQRKAFDLRKRRNAALHIQCAFRGYCGRKRYHREKELYLLAQTQSQGILFGKQMLLEYKLYSTKLQSEVAVLSQEKEKVVKDCEKLILEICEFEEGIELLEQDMHKLSKIEAGHDNLVESERNIDQWKLREQKMRLNNEFSLLLTQIGERKEKLNIFEDKVAKLEKERVAKEDELKSLERKLVVLLDQQQQELAQIKSKQDSTQSSQKFISNTMNGHAISSFGSPQNQVMSNSVKIERHNTTDASSSFTPKQREEAQALMESTETMMKFGFMSMSMTYFSSMNMVRAMRKIGAEHMTLDSAAAVSNHRWPEYSRTDPLYQQFSPSLPPGKMLGQQPLLVAGWSVNDVANWLKTLALSQYERAFVDAAVDGALLLHLNEEDLKNSLGIEHKLHRKKILTSVELLQNNETGMILKMYPSIGNGSGNSKSTNSVSTPTSSMSANTTAKESKSSENVINISPPIDLPHNAVNDPQIRNIPPPKPVISFDEFIGLARHGKTRQVKEMLSDIPDTRFDPLTVRQAFAPTIGTIYTDTLERSTFHINKSDEHGNSALVIAAQNNFLKLVQCLVSKGANPNHQNKFGNTASHYAMAYSFFDLGAWLLDPDKGGAHDDILNENGMSPYDGI